MREIKFRGWNTARNKVYSSEELKEDQLTLTVTGKFINVDSNRKENSEIYDHILPLQFTGLKDKNGKEIFEGDLVKNTINNETFAVTFKEGCYLYLFDNILSFWYKQLEIIGNIYETPVTS